MQDELKAIRDADFHAIDIKQISDLGEKSVQIMEHAIEQNDFKLMYEMAEFQKRLFRSTRYYDGV